MIESPDRHVEPPAGQGAADPERERRIAEVVGAVARKALEDRGLGRIALIDDGGPEARLAAAILEAGVGAGAVARVTTFYVDVEPLLHLLPPVSPDHVAEEMRRMRARLEPGALPAHPANKTALLLGGELPPEPLLPLGDLYASQVQALAGGWSAPEDVRALARAAGGVEALDAALRAAFEGRDPSALDRLPNAGAVRRALARGRASRVHPRIVPKLGPRTLCVDLFE